MSSPNRSCDEEEESKQELEDEDKDNAISTVIQTPGPASDSSNRGKIPEAGEADSTSTSRKYPRWVQGLAWYLSDQWFLIILAILIVIASQVQVPASHQQVKETVVTYLCVSIIFLFTGLTLPTRTLIQNYSRWKLHLFVQVQCFIMTSVLAYGVVSACATNKDFMDPGLLVGLIFMGCVPTTMSSNVVMTRQANGNQALTVVQSTVGNFLGPFLTPVLITMYTLSGAWYTKVLPQGNGGYDEIYRRVFKQLGLSIFLPMFVGQIIQNIWPEPTKNIIAKFKLNKLGSISLLVIIWQTYDSAFRSGAFTSIKGSNMVFIVFISIALFMIYLAVAFFTSILWLPKEDTIAVCYCVPAKTPAMGVPLSNVMFVGLSTLVESKIQIPMVIYQGLQLVFGSLLTIVFRKWVGMEKEDFEQTDV
jgi:sodium/bile acid cotransporter 7